jgi:hypothetical protein
MVLVIIEQLPGNRSIIPERIKFHFATQSKLWSPPAGGPVAFPLRLLNDINSLYND